MTGWIVLLILFSILFSGCTWFGGENEERIPTAILKSEGKNKAGNFVVRLDKINYPVRARNVEIAFLDQNGSKVVFSVGSNTTGVTLDQIYFSSYNGPNERNQVIYYDMDNDLRLAGMEANHTKDYFIIYPRLGVKKPGNSESIVANLTLILYWRDDSYIEQDRDETKDSVIGMVVIDSNNTVEGNILDMENTANDSVINSNLLLIILVILALLCIAIIIFLLRKTVKFGGKDNEEISNDDDQSFPRTNGEELPSRVEKEEIQDDIDEGTREVADLIETENEEDEGRGGEDHG